MLSNSLKQRRTLIFACFGIAIGLCIGTVLKNYRALELVKRCNFKTANHRTPNEIIKYDDGETIYNSQRSLVFVGVMTARNFLEGRARAVYETWGKEVPGRMAFFSSEGSHSEDLPVIGLKNVDDRYPPQKKSFMMLYYMFEHFIDKFEWFIRADDDVYIEPAKLERFLRSIDSSKPQFIGQAGKGNSEEFGLLSLEFDENFCMGGPGVILSSETLRRMAPHIPTCLKNLYSTHEDVEIGRCVQKYAGIPCTWNYEMQYILRHNSSGRYAYTGKLKRKEVHNAISLHPIKQAPLMYRMHAFIQGLKAEELRQDTMLLHRDIKRMSNYLAVIDESTSMTAAEKKNSTTQQQHFQDHNILGITPDLNKFVPATADDLLNWSFITRSSYSIDNTNPKQKIDSAMRESLEDIIAEVMETINNYSRQRGRIIEFRELLYGYQRLNALHGQDFILDLLLIYKKYRGKKMTVPVRRHLYLQRAFTGIFIRESNVENPTITQSTKGAKVKEKRNLSAHNDNDNDNRHHALYMNVEKLAQKLALSAYWGKETTNNIVDNNTANIVFVLPIAERFTAFKRFIDIYERVAILQDAHVELLVVIFGRQLDISEHLSLLSDLRQRHGPEHARRINYIQRLGNFSRGIALDTAITSAYIAKEDIILFIDVDIVFNLESLQRIRLNTLRGRQVYLPIVYSQYDPKHQSNFKMDLNRELEIRVDNDSGYFRLFGFGICAIYKSDILDNDIKGFDKDIAGWGLEDVMFLEELIKIGKKQHNDMLENTAEMLNEQNRTVADADADVHNLRIFRAPDPTFVHVYHKIECDVKLDAARYNMCLGTKANSLGSTKLMEHLFYYNTNNLHFIRELNRRIIER